MGRLHPFGRVAQRERRCLTSTRSGVQIPPRPPETNRVPIMGTLPFQGSSPDLNPARVRRPSGPSKPEHRDSGAQGRIREANSQILPRPPEYSNRPNGRFFVYTLRAAHAPHLGFQAFARVPKYASLVYQANLGHLDGARFVVRQVSKAEKSRGDPAFPRAIAWFEPREAAGALPDHSPQGRSITPGASDHSRRP